MVVDPGGGLLNYTTSGIAPTFPGQGGGLQVGGGLVAGLAEGAEPRTRPPRRPRARPGQLFTLTILGVKIQFGHLVTVCTVLVSNTTAFTTIWGAQWHTIFSNYGNPVHSGTTVAD